MQAHRATRFVTAFGAVAALAACGGGGGYGGTAPTGNGTPNTSVSTVTVSSTASSMTLGSGSTVTVSGIAKDASNNVVASTITWSSLDENVAVVTPAGVVYQLKAGTVAIKGAVGSVSNTVSITVNAAAGTSSALNVSAVQPITFSPTSVTILQNGSVSWVFTQASHNVLFGGVAGAPSDIAETSNTVASRTFGTKGTFNYQCTIHAGMTGSVVVQ